MKCIYHYALGVHGHCSVNNVQSVFSDLFAFVYSKVLFENLPAAFPDQILVESRTDEQTKLRHVVVVRGASSSIWQARQQQAKEREESELQQAIGFSK